MTGSASLALVLALAQLWAVAASAQRPNARPPTSPRQGELVFFSDLNFRGQFRGVSDSAPDLRLPFRARSYMVAPGDSWQVCANVNFRSPCANIDASRPDRGLLTFLDVRSARLTGGGEFSSTSYAGPSLRGMASEFFRAPESGGARVLACRTGPETASCAADTANRFCRARGYAGASFRQMETVRGRTFLADVLCTRTGA